MDKKEPIKDFLYDSLDYIFIVLIVAIVGIIISWRLNILFSNNRPIIKENEEKIESKEKESPDDNKEVKTKTLDEQIGKDSEDKKEGSKKEESKDNKDDVINVDIPKGSNSFDIAELLESKGVIKDRKAFLDKAEEMNLATKLKSGTFEIKKDDSLEEIIKKITK